MVNGPNYRTTKKVVMLVMGPEPIISNDKLNEMFPIKPLSLDNCQIERDSKDHGSRTNHKLKDQPFYARDRHGRMNKW